MFSTFRMGYLVIDTVLRLLTFGDPKLSVPLPRHISTELWPNLSLIISSFSKKVEKENLRILFEI